ncbi:peptidoglycan-associated lipoprotein Pal [Mycoavidus sp. HKI]|uniref:peptidoglycan-associated lipoprotein Pal n=1 Tax=Mycoavidus sp. HKI TaxID=2840467 RepID=UPI001CBD0738|nr:peptidoglycan-associated lipoprotein Pal [Mycoavidus sp. HKI]UAW63729.1 peptidoglycan-associated lipoprotein Pal [Mycoavidus sp. HKI]
MTSKFRLVFATLLIGTLAACQSGIKLAPNTGSENSANALGTPANPADTTLTAVDPLNDPNNPLTKRSVYFEFNSYIVNGEYQSFLQQQAHYLKSHPQQCILIQGNTDERGTSEYNLALGQKRAEAVRRTLSLMGVAETQMEAVSLGKEKPQATEHNESSWAQNRRADLVYQP